MMRRYTGRIIAIIGLLALLGAAPAEAKTFDSLTRESLEKLVAANKGKVVLVNFFAVWCPPCREEIPGLISIYKDYGKDKLLIIGASLDEDEKALEKYMKKVGINYPVKKATVELAQTVSVTGIPHLLIFDGKGEIAANQGGLVPENELREFLNTLMGGK